MYSHPSLPLGIRVLCKKYRLSQSKLAESAGISAATIRKIMDGGEVRLTAIVGIASGLGMTSLEFFRFLDELEAEKKVQNKNPAPFK